MLVAIRIIKKAIMDKNVNSIKSILIFLTIGIWLLVLQNFGVIPNKQNVYVKGGSVKVTGYVNADVTGSVDVDNTVDINIQQILGNNAGARRSYIIDGVEYNSLDVSIR